MSVLWALIAVNGFMCVLIVCIQMELKYRNAIIKNKTTCWLHYISPYWFPVYFTSGSAPYGRVIVKKYYILQLKLGFGALKFCRGVLLLCFVYF